MKCVLPMAINEAIDRGDYRILTRRVPEVEEGGVG